MTNKKFKLTKETKEVFGIKLYRIEAISDFGSVSKGDKGGWVDKEENVSIVGNAWVYGDAQVYGDAWVFSPPYIQGTRHALTLCSLAQIAIGCHVHDVSDWLKRYKAIGRSEGYTKEQIAEYGRHLAYLASIAKRLQAAAKKAAKTK